MFRPCIDLHDGKVKQIVGGTLTDAGPGPATNFVATESAGHFAARFRDDGLVGGHIIKLGPGNDAAAAEALAAFPGGLQLGGGVTAANAAGWLDLGASHVVVTSWLFAGPTLDRGRLDELVRAVGRDRLVLDLSCRRRGDDYVVTADRWQRDTDLVVTEAALADLGRSCAELLVHAVDVEGLARGIDEELVRRLGAWSPVPVTYAGGARRLEDLTRVEELGGGRVDLTIGSALDLFGGRGVAYADAVAFNRSRSTPPA